MTSIPVADAVAVIEEDLSTHSARAAPTDLRARIDATELKALLERSDAKGLQRAAGHLALILAGGVAVGFAWGTWWSMPALIFYGFTLVTMFAAMHESVHRTAFKSLALNDGMAWLAGVLSFYNGTFYRFYHGWHHRFTQIPGKDPELADNKPGSLLGYLVEISGITWWYGKVLTYAKVATGQLADYPFVPEKSRAEVVRSVRLQLGVYLVAIIISLLVGHPWFIIFWLLPVAIAQPFLRMIVLSEHTGCTEDSNPLTNTRTTYTIPLVHYLMWDMPFHVEHHHYPALPFHALGTVHAKIRPQLVHVATAGYLEVQREFIRSFFRRRAA